MKRVSLLLLLLLFSCSDCRSKTETKAAESSLTPTPDWIQGKLPASVNQGTPRAGGTLTVRVNVEPNGINRLHDRYQDGWSARMTVGTVYETLLELDRDDHPRYRLKPKLAESYAISPDGLTNTVKLRRGVRFHNGESFTSRDVKAVMDALMDEKNPTTTMRSFFVDLASYDAPDDYTFVLHWKRPYYFGFRNFATALPMMPASALKGDFDTLPIARSPIGTGPFKFQSWETGSAITLVRNDSYWGQKASLDRIVFRIVKDATVATQLFEHGEFDLMTGMTPSVWRSIEKPVEENQWVIDGYHRIYFVENNYAWIGWNELRPYFKEREVRRALGMLYPADEVLQNIDLGLEIPTTCPFYLYSPNCDESVERLRYDPKAAKVLLDEAGWKDTNGDGIRDKNGVPLKFTFLLVASSVKQSQLAPLLQEEYRKAGIELDVEKVDWAIFKDRLLAHDFDVASMIWSQLDVEQDLYQTFHSSQTSGSNYVSYNNPEVDRLLVEARAEFDPEKRAALNRRLHRILYDDQVYTFLSVRPALDAVKVRVHGIKPSLAWYDLSKVWVSDGANDGGAR
ncbi:MAG: ABC transporter substrate-binding protein [Myxococcaceae bacterium]